MKIDLNLSTETETALKLKASMGGSTASELLSAFVHDLVCGEESNGWTLKSGTIGFLNFAHTVEPSWICNKKDPSIEKWAGFFRFSLKV